MDLQDVELREIHPFFASLEREKELVMMTADSAIKSKFVAGVRANGELAGIVGIRMTYGFIPELFIVVKEEYQGMHLSNELMEKELHFAQENYNFLTLSTYLKKEYEAALYLYEKYGFKYLRKRRDHYWMYIPFNGKGKIIGRLLPFIYPLLPYLSSLFSGRILVRVYRRLFRRKI